MLAAVRTPAVGSAQRPDAPDSAPRARLEPMPQTTTAPTETASGTIAEKTPVPPASEAAAPKLSEKLQLAAAAPAAPPAVAAPPPTALPVAAPSGPSIPATPAPAATPAAPKPVDT